MLLIRQLRKNRDPPSAGGRDGSSTRPAARLTCTSRPALLTFWRSARALNRWRVRVPRRALVRRNRERHSLDLPGEHLVVGADELDRHLMRPGLQVGDVDRVVIAGIRPPPRQIIDNDVEVPDPGRNVLGARPENVHDAQVLHPVLCPEDTDGEPLGQRRVDEKLRCGLVLDRYIGRATADFPCTLRECARSNDSAEMNTARWLIRNPPDWQSLSLSK